MKTVIFDFNGTLFIDHDINEIAWKKMLNEITEGKLDVDNFYAQYKSVHNYLCIKNAFEAVNNPQSDDVINALARKKETYYQNYCVEHKRNRLNAGAEELLDYLKQNNVRFGLCTSSIIENVEFYYNYIGIGRWFDMKYTVYDDGNYSDKIQMYKDCAKKLGTDIKDVVVFEDSPKSIKEAIAAGCENVVAIKRNDTPSLPQIKQIISNFTELDRGIFEL